MNTTTQTPEMHPNARELAAQIEADAITELSANAFAAYNVQAGGKTWDGKDIPPWEKTGEKVQANWRAALRTTLAKIDLTRLVHFHGAEGDPLNALLVRAIFPVARGRAWLLHNVEEVGNWEHFLPQLFTAARAGRNAHLSAA